MSTQTQSGSVRVTQWAVNHLSWQRETATISRPTDVAMDIVGNSAVRWDLDSGVGVPLTMGMVNGLVAALQTSAMTRWTVVLGRAVMPVVAVAKSLIAVFMASYWKGIC